MRYSESRKLETRHRVLKVAARALRKEGPEKIGVVEVMRAAGLTHGGFYAHFKSKDALLAETVDQIFAESAERLRRIVDGLPPRHALATYIDSYVSARHRDDASGGCPIVALSSDLPRQSKKFQERFNEGVKLLIDTLAKWIADTGTGNSQRLASSVLSAMVGAVAMARAVTDPTLSDELLEAARTSIKTRLGVNDVQLAKARA
jgi:TetR/AcrR family transcriptional repressor of nem operon